VTELHVVEVAAVLRELTARLIASVDLDDALGELVDTAAGLVDGESWCAVTLVRAGCPSIAAASKGLPEGLDDRRYETGDTPSMHAIRTRDLAISPNLTTERRWPVWRGNAVAGGVLGVLSVPVDIDEHSVGALNLYSADADRFGADIGFTALLVAEHAGLLLASVLDRGRLAGLTAELTEALGDGETVNRAIGIMMAQRSCSAEVALAVLRETAGRLHIPLATVAARLVDTVESRATPV
jgi:GAF domain-containing protein